MGTEKMLSVKVGAILMPTGQAVDSMLRYLKWNIGSGGNKESHKGAESDLKRKDDI